MLVNEKGKNLLHEFEGLKLKAYLCPANIWTIGYGNTFYEDGTRVKQGDVITKERAEQLFENIIDNFAKRIKGLITKKLNENQFSALVSFTYNVGVGAFNKSTLLRKVNANPTDPTIHDEFMKWNKAGGVVLNGLVRRRKAESELYFTDVC